MTNPPSGPWAPNDPVPAYGYQIPGQFGYPAPGYSPDDPLVPPPAAQFEAWYRRVVATFGRSWQPLFLVFAVLSALPQIALLVIGYVAGYALAITPETAVELFQRPEVVIGSILVALVLGVATVFLNCVAWAAAIWVVTENAAGRPASLATAVPVGLSRALPMFGWYLLVGLIVAVGTIFCVLPGLYFGVALSLFSFVIMFERGTNPIGRSFTLVNGDFGAALGRVALLFLVDGVASMLVSCAFGGSAFALSMNSDGELVGGPSGGTQLVSGLVNAVVQVPLDSLLVVGLLLVYTQVRGRREPLSTPQLWASING